jgi:oligopeptide/dipeptide ABC transporter ATP-binding protein
MPGRFPETRDGATMPLLEVRDLVTEVHARGRRFDVLRGVDLTISAGETVGVAGESGSGKTMLVLSVLGLLPATGVRVRAGSVRFAGADLLQMPGARRRALLGDRLSVVFQDPLTSLNPLFTVGAQVAEVISQHRQVRRSVAEQRARDLLEAVRIPDADRRVHAYPHELSGGQRQRVAIAMAIANEPELLIADEPTTALDVTVQAEILDLMTELQHRIGMAMLFITHDLGVMEEVSDRLAVMYAGRVVEHGATTDVLTAPRHPDTRRLLECVPRLGGRAMPRPITGLPPPLDDLPSGCAFHPRCDVAEPRCAQHDVVLDDASGHPVACVKPGARP